MFDYRQYIIAVTAAAIIGSIGVSVCDKKNASSAVVKLIVGIMMTLTMLKPLIEIEIGNLADYLSSVEVYASDSLEAGSMWADSATSVIIKERTESYILDKAASIGSQISIDITLSEHYPFTPSSATITGAVSPYAKSQLSEILVNDIGILKENQIWIQ